MINILLTGGTGFIGRNILELLGDKYHFFAPRRDELNLFNEDEIKRYIIEKKITIIIHAAITNEQKLENGDVSKALDYNLRMFFNLARCEDVVDKMIYFGSGAEYDKNYYIPNMEESYLGVHIPTDIYGFSKYIMAQYAEKSRKIYDLVLFGVYGPHEDWRRRLISNVIYQCECSDKVFLKHNMLFDYLFIDDLINVLDWFIQNNPKHHRYNICTGENVELIHIAKTIINCMDSNKIILCSNSAIEGCYSGNNYRINDEIKGLKFKNVVDGVKYMIDYYNKHNFE